MTDPRRLLDDGSPASPELRALLESARSDDPIDGRIAALTTRLGPLLAPLAPPLPPPTTPVVAGTAVLAAKIGGALVAAGLVVGGAWFAYDRSRETPPEPPSAPVLVTLPDPPAPPPAREIIPDAPTTTLPPPKPAAPRHVDSEAEAALVRAAQAALLRDDAGDALALTRQHATRFASGPHAEERDRIAIEALVRLGRLDEAHAQAREFFTRYPRSIYRPRIEALLP